MIRSGGFLLGDVMPKELTLSSKPEQPPVGKPPKPRNDDVIPGVSKANLIQSIGALGRSTQSSAPKTHQIDDEYSVIYARDAGAPIVRWKLYRNNYGHSWVIDEGCVFL